MSGQRFGRLLVKSYFGRLKPLPAKFQSAWICICDCGKIAVAPRNSLVRGKVRSCGCLNSENRALRATHGHTRNGGKTPEYSRWKAIKERCLNPNHVAYKHYGGRGITVCERWKKSFENFLKDMGNVPTGMEIDRIDNNGNYCPENCRWATRKEQTSNTRVNHIITYKGESKTMTQWSEHIGIKRSTFEYRVYAGWSGEKLFAHPSRKQEK